MPLTRLVAALALLPLPVLAGPVELSAPDGSFSLEGELLSHDGEFFRLKTAQGEVTVDGGALQCSGAGCPEPSEMVARASVGGPPEMIHRLLPGLMEVFADLRGYDLVRRFTADDSVSWELRERGTERLLAVFEAAEMPDEVALQRLSVRDLDIAFGRGEGASQVRQDVIALDALLPIVAPDNPRAMVTFVQLGKLLSGDIASWSRLGGEPLPVRLHLPEGYDVALRRLHSGGGFAEATRHTDPEALSDAVAADPAALGLVPYSAIGNAVPLIVGGACGLATPATRETIRAEDYPVTQPLFLHRIGARQPKIVRDFIAFARSPEAQPVIRSVGFVDQAIGRIGFERQGSRIANAVLAAGDDPQATAAVRDMIATLMDGERLTLTFRFRDGSSDLDPQSVSNIRRLSDAIARGAFDGRQLLFAGFSDGVGSADGNLRLSERRARSVLRAVSARVPEAPVTLDWAAFGELMPMACDDLPWGRQVNRRVEVWLK